MKISLKLQSQINRVIDKPILDHMILLDSLFRSGQISHDVWDKTHKSACALIGDIQVEVRNTIDKYHK
jgi:hypothetical protein